MTNSYTFAFTSKASFVVSIIFFFFSITQLINKKKPLSNYFLSVLYLALGVQCLSFWLYSHDSPLFENYLYFSDSALLFLTGPFLYLFFLYITRETPITLRTILLNAAPFFASFFLIERINLIYPILDDKMGLLTIDLIITLSYLSLFIYLILIFRILSSNFKKGSKSPEKRFLIYIIICSMFFSFTLLLSNTLWPELQLISHIAFIFIGLFFIFFLIRYPDYFRKAQKKSQEIRYRNSQLMNLDKEKVVARLDSLFKMEKIYREQNLTLKTLSEKLNISSPQLSEFLSSHYKTNFNTYINSYRIKEVKKNLKERSDVNLLAVALDCGFNSKSTFNDAFRKLTGLTPSQYRAKINK